jgi:hypothetical protein
LFEALWSYVLAVVLSQHALMYLRTYAS